MALSQDLSDRDVRQSEIRLYGLIVALALDYPIEQTQHQAIENLICQERQHYHEPICERYHQFSKLWVVSRRNKFKIKWNESRPGWSEHRATILEKHLQDISDLLYADDKDLRRISVRELMCQITDPAALTHLRQARKILERYQLFLLQQSQYLTASKPSPEFTPTLPDWQQQINAESDIHCYYAQQMQKIRSDSTIEEPEKSTLIERLQQLWDQSHFEMLQSENIERSFSGPAPIDGSLSAPYLLQQNE